MNKVDAVRMATWASYIVLLGQQALDAALYGAPAIFWAVKLLPLLLFLPGMLRDRLRSYIWLCFVCLGYFIRLVERQFADPSSVVVAAGLAAVVILFLAAMLYVRWRARQMAESQEETESTV